MNSKPVHMAAVILLWVGGLNWGLTGALNFNLVHTLFESLPVLERAVYVLVGVAALVELATHMQNCKLCAEEPKKKGKK